MQPQQKITFQEKMNKSQQVHPLGHPSSRQGNKVKLPR